MKCMIAMGPRTQKVAIAGVIMAGMVGIVAFGSDEVVTRVLDLGEDILQLLRAP